MPACIERSLGKIAHCTLSTAERWRGESLFRFNIIVSLGKALYYSSASSVVAEIDCFVSAGDYETALSTSFAMATAIILLRPQGKELCASADRVLKPQKR